VSASDLPGEPAAIADEISIVRANALTFGELNDFLGRYADRLESALRPDEPYLGLGYVARSATKLVGVVLFYLVPSIVPGVQLCFLVGAVDPQCRRRGVGSSLLTEVLAAVSHADGGPALIAHLPDGDTAPAAAFLERFGFAELAYEARYELNLTGIKFAATDPRFECREYRGGDPAMDRVIVDLHRRAYRGKLCTADLTEELLALRLANPRCCYDLFFHEGQLIGYVSSWNNDRECFVDSLLVTRRYWGGGASDALFHELERVATKRGAAKLATTASGSNRAVINLMDRRDAREVKKTRCFYRQLSNRR
jgi:GNAT superfamily N-acetyltransferase